MTFEQTELFMGGTEVAAPFVPWLVDGANPMQGLLHFLLSQGTFGTAVGFLLQGLGVPVPVIVNFGWLYATVAAGYFDATAACGLALASSWTGNMLAYLGGRLLGDAGWRLLPIRAAHLRETVTGLARRHLAWGLLASRWLGGYPQLMWAVGAARGPGWPLALLALGCNALWVYFWWMVFRLGMR